MARTEQDERQDGEAPAATVPASPRRGRGRVATAISVFGELLITVGLLLGLFVVYSLWWTNVIADREAKRQGNHVREIWRTQGPGKLDTKDGIGFLHVPAMHNGEVLVKRGTSTEVLNDGVAGFYTEPLKSAMPWDKKGNFTLAAHRDGHGAKFHNIDKLDKGDVVVVETRDTWYVYKVFAKITETSKFNTGVLKPVPKGSGKTHAGRYITLTTCTPVYTSRYRYVVWGELVRTEQVDKDRTPPRELD
ncbi:class E sortase [Streptomyces palmae]|uniref:Class E sortase n=1 Tax=Streptomyces palmae TaxID=1701085 RepID=A0A4Z0GN37_9ACTN|nr:class E sortase [Streptomyces palmae]TGA97297.1 class E sortase [Streptomyces palmae]